MMQYYLIPGLLMLAITTALPAGDDPVVDKRGEAAEAVRPAAASNTLAPAPDYADPADSQKKPAKPKQSDGPGYTQLGSQIILHLDREKTELSLYENSAYIIMTKRDGIVANGFSNRLLVEIEESDGGAVAFRTLKPGIVWLTFYGKDEKRYVVEITIMGDTRALTAQLKQLYPDSNINAIKVGKGVLLRGDVSKAEHVAEVIEIAEQHYPKALNQLKVKAGQRYVVPSIGQAPIPVPDYQQPVGLPTKPARRLTVPKLRPNPHNGQFGILPYVFEVDWQILAKSKVDLVSELRRLDSGPDDWELPSTRGRADKKQPKTIVVTVPRRTVGGAIQVLKAIKGVDLIRLPEMALSTNKPARVSKYKMFPVVTTRVGSNGQNVLETKYQPVGTTLTLTTDQNSLEHANLGFEVEHEFPFDRSNVDADRDVSADIGTHRLSGTVRLQSDQAIIVAETGPHATKPKQPVSGTGLVIVIVPSHAQAPSAAANSAKPAGFYQLIPVPANQPAIVNPIDDQRGLRNSVRELRGDVRALRNDVKKLLKLLEDQTSAVPSVAPTVGSIRRRIKESKAELLVFEAPWCGPCQKMAPRLDEQAARGYSVRRLDIDKFRELAHEFHVTAVPTIIAFSNGKEEERWTGVRGSDELTRIVDKYAPRNRPVTWKELRKSRATTAKRTSLKALDREVSLEFNEKPLEDTIREISKTSQLNIVLDRRGLDEEGVTPKTPVTVIARGIKLSNALNLILEPLNLAQQVRDEVVVVTSRQRSRGEMTVVTYPVADLVIPIPTSGLTTAQKQSDDEHSDQANRPSVQSPAVDFDTLTAMIQSTVQPDSWNVVGGSASIQPFETTLSLVIRQTLQAHEEIAELLQQQRQLQDMQVMLEPRYLDNLPDQLWEKIRGQLDSKLASEASLGGVILNNDQAKLVLEAVQNDARTNVMQLPHVTLFNGQTAGVAQFTVGGQQQALPQLLHFQPVISADRRNIRLGLRVRNRESPANTARAFVRTVPDGGTLLIEVTEPEGNPVGVPILQKIPYTERLFKNTGNQPTGRRFLLVRPQVLVLEEEEELLGIPVKKAR